MGKTIGILIGLLLALIAQFLAFALGGAGHGWTVPFFANSILWVFLPLTFATVSPLGEYPHGNKPYLLSLLAAALVTNAALVVTTIRHGSEYFWKIRELGGGFDILWLMIWFSWQLVVLLAFLQGEESADDVEMR